MSASAWESGVGRLGTGPAVPLAALLLREHGAGLGWRGWGRVRQADRASAPALFARAQEHGLVPGAPVMLTLSPAGGGPVRSWPSVLTDLVVRSGDGDGDVPAVCVRIADPLTHLGAHPLHAVFEGRSPGQIVIGCLARAAGAGVEDGPLRFAHPAFPTVSAAERLGEDFEPIGCALACGEPMLEFVRRLLGEVGVAIAVRGLASGEVRVELADGAGAPDGNTGDAVRLAASFAAETGEETLQVRRLAVEGPARPGSTEGRKSDGGTGTGTDTGTKGWVPRLSARSEAPGIRAGGRVELTGGPVAETHEWRVLAATHRLADRAYENVSFLEPYGAGPLIAPAAGEPSPRTLTAAVDEDGSDPGAPVAVDAKGRLRMRLASDPGAAVRLPCIVPSAGAVHGFAPAFCRGDRVRVRVNGPLRVEVAGALWSEALAPDEETRGAAQAMRIAPGLGAAFHPPENVPEMAQ